MIYVLKGKITQSAVWEKSCQNSIFYVNDVTEHDGRYELVELNMDLANSTLPKSQFQFAQPIRK